jgi:hypothetical protein
LLNDCAEGLASVGHTHEAAILFEKAENWEMACKLYIQLKQFTRVDLILPHVTNSKLHSIYAKVSASAFLCLKSIFEWYKQFFFESRPKKVKVALKKPSPVIAWLVIWIVLYESISTIYLIHTVLRKLSWKPDP